jgi:hypothetical protein
MWDQGKAAKAIGDALGTTKNAVLGRKFRLKLEERPATSGYKGGRKPGAKARRKRAIFVTKMERTVVLTHEPVGFMDLAEHHCREVVGRGPDTLATYCGGERMGVISKGIVLYISSYCEHHSSINFRND